MLPALIGITDQHLVKITAASHILQYLITCPPSTAMDVDTRKPKKFFIMKKLTIFCLCVQLSRRVVQVLNLVLELDYKSFGSSTEN